MKKDECNSNKMERLAKKIEFLDDPQRRGDIPPEKLMDMLPVKKVEHMLDLGAGTGYFTIPFAKFAEGTVYALDIDPQMLEVISSKAEAAEITNILPIQSSIDDLTLPEHSVDLVLASLVLHEVKHLPASLQQIQRVLKNAGYFICIELEKKDDATHHHPRISSSLLEQKIMNAGLEIVQKLNPTDTVYIIIAKK